MRKRIIALIKTYNKSVMIIGAADFTISIALFQILQSWCDHGINNNVLRWIFPFLVAIVLFMIIISVYANILLYRGAYMKNEPPEMLAKSILMYAEQLKNDNRDVALVDFRNRLTYILHVLGSYEIRVELGTMALASATIIHDEASVIEILIDDLGWCNSLLKNDEQPINYINKGIGLAEQYLKEKPFDIRVSLAKAKGMRHLAILRAKDDIEFSNKQLTDALAILNKLDNNDHQVKTDIAQIYHARASVIFRNLGIDHDFKLREEDKEGRNKIWSAIENVKNASKQFEQIGEMDRYVKSLYLHYSLLECINDKEGCIEIAAIKERALKSSQWISDKGIEGIIK